MGREYVHLYMLLLNVAHTSTVKRLKAERKQVCAFMHVARTRARERERECVCIFIHDISPVLPTIWGGYD